ncbi:hypothetical protein [Saccharopolyspora sp. ASAGF58]|uniref:hypothetical protein n=1 Tax=Saccharopolyspora sp. ASAGF58 TaxID=2719023 RepID=UPI001440041D|nr:hypothetical protein [Saccharopolyspora sp. ASAGF58]QIZ34308.1 hypothetical protein FDZ84_05595 [Saccharopolyspora sp. ASAGF58]
MSVFGCYGTHKRSRVFFRHAMLAAAGIAGRVGWFAWRMPGVAAAVARDRLTSGRSGRRCPAGPTGSGGVALMSLLVVD